MVSELERAALEFRRSLLARERAAAGEMVRAYGAIWTDLQEGLARLQEQIAAARARGETISAGWLLRGERLAALQEQAERQLREFAGSAATTIRQEQAQAVTAALSHSSELVRIALAQPPAGFEAVGRQLQALAVFSRLPERAVEHLVGHLSDGSPLAALLGQLPGQASEGVKKALIVGVGTGQNPRETARAVRQALGGSLDRALTISRTETLRAYREATRRSYAEHEDVLEGWVWLSALDGRACPACVAMHGTVHPTSERLDGHPNCRCVMAPRTKTWEEILGVPGVAETRPEIEPGEEWFRRQPPSRQEEILGPGAFAAYQCGEVTLGDFVGQKHSARWGSMRYTRSLTDAKAAALGGGPPAGTPPPPTPPTPPAPSGGQGPRPGGTPVSQALRIAPGAARDPLRHAVRVIDTVHGDGNLPQIPVQLEQGVGRFGALHSRRAAPPQRGVPQHLTPQRITVNSGGPHQELTTVHEIGHFLDLAGMGPAGAFTSDADPLLQDWRNAVSNTQAVRGLQALRRQATTTHRIPGGQRTSPVDQQHVTYLLRYRELWARSYAQYITTRSNDPALRAQLRQILDGHHDPAYAARHWEDADFAPVAEAIDRLFEALGWRIP